METRKRVQTEARCNAKEVIHQTQLVVEFSLHPAVFPDLDYARLKRSFEYFVEHYTAAELTTPAQRALAIAIADFVEGTQDFCRERVSEIDRDLQKRDAYTLSFLREHCRRDQKTNV